MCTILEVKKNKIFKVLLEGRLPQYLTSKLIILACQITVRLAIRSSLISYNSMFSHQRDFNFNCYAGTEPEMDDLADNPPVDMIKDGKLKLPWWSYISL